MKLPLWRVPEAHCDQCGQMIADTPPGLVSVDREIGMFGGDYTACSNCVVSAHYTGHLGPQGGTSTTSMMRDGVQYAYIHWYWWPGHKTRRKAFITTGRAFPLVKRFFEGTTITVLKETRQELGVDLRKAIALYARRIRRIVKTSSLKEFDNGSM